MATVLLVQLAIAVLGFGVLAIAAAPALTRPGRHTAARLNGAQSSPRPAALLRGAARRVATTGQDLGTAAATAAAHTTAVSRRGAARVRLGAQETGRRVRREAAHAAAGGAQAADAAIMAVSRTGSRTSAAISRRSTLLAAAVSRQVGGGRATRQSPAEQVIDLRDKRPAAGSTRPRHRA